MNIQDLVEELNYYTKLYDEGHPAISDQQWDDMYFTLEQLEKEEGIYLSDSPTQKIDYQVINSLNKVTHNHPMLSLNKTKNIKDVINFSNGHRLIAMAKIDGLTCSLRYLNGKLISAETRGNGIIGEDITHNIVHVAHVPLTLPVKHEVIIDGEIICKYNDFEKFKNEYANPRNFAAGSIRLLDSKECAKRKLSFIAWDCIKGLDDDQELSSKYYHMCQDWKFTPAPWLHLLTDMTNEDKIKHIIYLLKEWAKKDYIPIDGIVFKYDNCEYYNSLGATNHHFRGGLAYKFYDEEYETRLRNIEWTMGRTGVLTPVAIFDPIDDGETIISRASLHNVTIMRETLYKPYVGEKVWIAKMNAIIPQIVNKKWVANDYDPDINMLKVPTICPICGGRTEVRKDNDSEVLICTNPDCDGRLINQLNHFAGKKGLDIKGLSKATLEKLIDLGWLVNVEGIFSLKNYRNEWIKLSGFGVKSVDNILDAIEQSKNCEMANFITALGIPLIGSTYAKDICKHEETWTNFKRDIEDGFDFSEWNGFGCEMNKAIHDYDYFEADHIGFDILNLKNSLFNNKKENTALDGKKICITGSLNKYKNRDEFIKDIEAYGGKVVSSVSKNTNILINNDIESNSSKNQNAKKFNIPILTEEDFINKYLT